MLHKLELRDCCFFQTDCVEFLERLPKLNFLTFHAFRIQIGGRWAEFLLSLRNSSTLNLDKIDIWYAQEYEEQRGLMNQQFWKRRYVCFSDPKAMQKRHSCHEERPRRQYKASSSAQIAVKLEQWAENAHSF